MLAQKELQKSVENIDRKISFCYMEYQKRSIQTQFLEIKKKLEEKNKNQLCGSYL